VALSDKQANQIATLLNARNALTRRYDQNSVEREGDQYLLRLDEEQNVIAVVQLKRVQWYQHEILHLTVAKAHEGRGYAKSLLREAECRAGKHGAKLLQCTIREGNTPSRRLFESCGFIRVSSYHNERSAKNVDVFQKVIVPVK
jgi:RimJ/RimL family protein N-acetyltransferase